jgi:fused signal recognition particle receptor
MFKGLMDRFDRLMGRGVIDDQFYEELEEALLATDTSVAVTHEILDDLRKQVREEKITDPAAMKERLKAAISHRFGQQEAVGLLLAPEDAEPPTVFLFVGVNGVGKTTTIAKVAKLLKKSGLSVMMAAGDTFRAAAIEQLETWADRAGAEIVRSQSGSDASAVIFDAIQAARARNIDVVLADTAGRQHSKANLMKELEKVVRVTEKALGRKPDEVLLVLDANTGQNAIRQAEEFTKAVGVTGLILTKLDGTARGGALIGIYNKFRIPIKMIGLGEKMDDLKDFKPKEFVSQLFN